MADPTFGELGTLTFTLGSSNSGTTTIADVAVGDLIIVAAGRYQQDDCTGIASTSPALTFTRVARAADATLDYQLDLWAAIATTAASSMTITASYSTSAAVLQLYAARYANGQSITLNASSAHTALQASSTNRTNANITTTERTLLIVAGGNVNGFWDMSPATNWTERVDNNSPYGASSTLSYLYERIADAGTYPSGNYATSETADTYMSVLAAFPVQSAAASVVPVLIRQYAARQK
jgi:hypothetical protein